MMSAVVSSVCSFSCVCGCRRLSSDYCKSVSC